MEEFNIFCREIETIKKNIGRYVNKEEFLLRLNTFNSDVNLKF